MDFNLHKSFHIEDRSYLSLVKNYVRDVATHADLAVEEKGKLDIIVTELITNLVKYAHSGRKLLIKPVLKGTIPGVEIISIDKGPGMTDVSRRMEDGYSSSGTKGEGLGAIKRLSDEFDIYSVPRSGTIVLSRIYKKKVNIYDNDPKERLEIKSIQIAKPGEELCGDGFHLAFGPNDVSILLTDGLGHGPEAHLASQKAIDVFKENLSSTPDHILKTINESIRKTRGAVGMVLNFNLQNKILSYCGVGNISCKVFSFDETRNLISFNGILGLNVSRVNSNTVSWESGKLAIIYSDGMLSTWELASYHNITAHDLSILTAALYRDYFRKTDDFTVIAIRNKK